MRTVVGHRCAGPGTRRLHRWLGACKLAAAIAILLLARPAPAQPPASVASSSAPMPKWMPYGGVHEFGVWSGLSWVSGPILGYRTQVHYAPVDVRYSYLMTARQHLTARYSPEITVLAWLDEPILDANNNVIGRKHTFGGGLSPVGFQLDFRPSHRVQPFASCNGGFIYFADRVLSPEGSQLMFTADWGGGFNIHLRDHRALTVGFRYEHMSNANIAQHNPGTAADTFYVGYSQFRTHGLH